MYYVKRKKKLVLIIVAPAVMEWIQDYMPKITRIVGKLRLGKRLKIHATL